jgi:hypothetical protein
MGKVAIESLAARRKYIRFSFAMSSTIIRFSFACTAVQIAPWKRPLKLPAALT